MIQHIAFIMDGNRRWAKEQGKSVKDGHYEGAQTLKRVLEHLQKKGVRYVTVYALSSENLKTRSQEELAVHFGLHKKYLREEVLDTDRFLKEGIRFKVLGRVNKLPEDVKELIFQAEEKTRKCDKFFFNVCLVYNGQDEIVNAVQEIIKDGIPAEDITKDIIKKFLYTADTPAPELIVRTGMDPEKRLSGFLLWDSSYSEFAFTKTYWPALSDEEIDEIIADFEDRERRFGS